MNYSLTSNLLLRGAKSRLFYFNHPPGTWVGAPPGHNWKTEPWHSWVVALINTGQTGLTMVIYDVDCVTKDKIAAKGKPWNVKSLTLHRSYFEYWHSKLKRNIRRVYYNQNVEHRGKGRCLKFSLKSVRRPLIQGRVGRDPRHQFVTAMIGVKIKKYKSTITFLRNFHIVEYTNQVS